MSNQDQLVRSFKAIFAIALLLLAITLESISTSNACDRGPNTKSQEPTTKCGHEGTK